MRHIALIMDGNGRWASAGGNDRLVGHIEGANALMRAIVACENAGIPCATFYAFSTENFKRGKREVLGIFGIMADFFENLLLPRAAEKGYRVRFLGNLSLIDDALLESVNKLNAATLNNKGMQLNFALAYGGRAEITAAVSRLVESRFVQGNAAPVHYEELERWLYTVNLPDPDLVIRYGGHKRLSNFMPLQTVYSELLFTDTLWPDFNEAEFADMLNAYRAVQKNYGDIPK